jgi:hypothetical protein
MQDTVRIIPRIDCSAWLYPDTSPLNNELESVETGYVFLPKASLA